MSLSPNQMSRKKFWRSIYGMTSLMADGRQMSLHRARENARNSLLVQQDRGFDSLMGEEYLEATSVKVYVEDALKQMLQDRPENTLRFFEKYFTRSYCQIESLTSHLRTTVLSWARMLKGASLIS